MDVCCNYCLPLFDLVPRYILGGVVQPSFADIYSQAHSLWNRNIQYENESSVYGLGMSNKINRTLPSFIVLE